MNNQPELIEMMNEKIDELVARGVPFFQAKLVIAQAMIETLQRCGVDNDSIVKFAAIISR